MSREAKGGWIEYTESSFSYWRGKDGTRFVLLLYWESAHSSLRCASSITHLSCWTQFNWIQCKFNQSLTANSDVEFYCVMVIFILDLLLNLYVRACAVNKKLLFIHYNINVCIWFDEAEIGCLNNIVATFLSQVLRSLVKLDTACQTCGRNLTGVLDVSLRPCL